MATQLFVNLPVKDLDKSVEFFTALGFSFNPDYTDENATCMILNDNAFVMLLVEKFFQTFTNKPVADARASTEVLMAISTDSRDEVDDMVRKALEAGGSPSNEPQDLGFMYSQSFQDLDGHQWEVLWMDESSVPE
ncbi:VOC family protein [Arthrobacter sp. ISL-30]|uniref:VOC family protein n=1 Tax=Arthrobacter sp. ISL-30 TaxID=2819109 RepID=UPI001BE834FA|nr:VOC family protein [Arthrobacter sp. ISL-30]MBT2512097.1 VOC family protein [Arthrobacter sp. ISL-30]